LISAILSSLPFIHKKVIPPYPIAANLFLANDVNRATQFFIHKIFAGIIVSLIRQLVVATKGKKRRGEISRQSIND
jgi:hypothetical protein